MSEPLELTPPATCSVTRYHRPRATRFVWHHIHPLGDGGQNRASNRLAACDNCHYAIHTLIDLYRRGVPTWGVRRRFPRGVQRWARHGWALITSMDDTMPS